MVAGIQADDGSHTVLSDWNGLALTVATASGATVTTVEPGDVPELLATNFGLAGFAIGTDGRLV
jgi:hypothetical protein